jgi:hypothetical protein
MRKGTPEAAMTASAKGTISRSGKGDGSPKRSSRRPSHWATLKTVKRLRKGTCRASSPLALARSFSVCG